jgi:hypothetical protein
MPPARLEVLNEQTPAEFNGTCPSTTDPSWNVTMPDGLVDWLGTGATVAVKVTVCPTFDGLGDEVSVVVVALAWTFCMSRALPVLKFASPL